MTAAPHKRPTAVLAPDAPPATGDVRARRRSLLAGGVGNALEWYDWNIYALFAPLLAAALFDDGSDVSALLSTFAVFAVGFFMRPLGGVLFGVLADRIGRRTVMVVTLSMTAGSSLLIGVIPSYGQIGVWASLLLLLARLVQGLGHGGESSVSYAYIAEIAPNGRRGLWSSSVYVSVTVGSLLATGLGAILTSTLSDHAMATWGWRVPFLLGGVLGLYALVLRRRAVETDVHRQAVANTSRPQPWATRRVVGAGARILIISASIGVMYYTWIALGATVAITQHGMGSNEAFVASFLALLVPLGTLPLFGWWSDRVGRRPFALFYAFGMAVLAFPLTFILSGAGWTLFVAQSLALLAWAGIASIYPAVVSEVLPTQHRTRVIGIAGSTANAAFGGTAPYLHTLLVSHDIEWLYTSYLATLCVLAGAVILKTRETKDVDLAAVA